MRMPTRTTLGSGPSVNKRSRVMAEGVCLIVDDEPVKGCIVVVICVGSHWRIHKRTKKIKEKGSTVSGPSVRMTKTEEGDKERKESVVHEWCPRQEGGSRCKEKRQIYQTRGMWEMIFRPHYYDYFLSAQWCRCCLSEKIKRMSRKYACRANLCHSSNSYCDPESCGER